MIKSLVPGIILSFLLMIALPLAAQTNGKYLIGKQANREAMTYHFFISQEVETANNSMLDLINSFDKGPKVMSRKLKSFRSQVKYSQEELEGLKAFENDTTLKKSAQELLAYYAKISSGDLAEMIKMLGNKEGIDVEKINTMTEKIAGSQAVLALALKNAENNFAEKYGFDPEKNLAVNKLKKA